MLLLVGLVLLGELVCIGVRLWYVFLPGTAPGALWAAAYAPLGFSLLTFSCALVCALAPLPPRASPASTAALRGARRLLARMRGLPVYALLLASVMGMTAMVLAEAVLIGFADGSAPLLLGPPCVLALVVHMQLCLMIVPWRSGLVALGVAAALVPWFVLTVVFVVPALPARIDVLSREATIAYIYVVLLMATAATLALAQAYMHERQRRADYAKRVQDQIDRSAVLEAEAQAKAKSAAVSHISHELRTPLSSILCAVWCGADAMRTDNILGRLSAELLQSTQMDHSQQRYLDNVATAAQQLLSLVNDILDIAKLEAGELRLKMAPIVVKDLIEAALEMVSPLALDKGLELYCSVRCGAHCFARLARVRSHAHPPAPTRRATYSATSSVCCRCSSIC